MWGLAKYDRRTYEAQGAVLDNVICVGVKRIDRASECMRIMSPLLSMQNLCYAREIKSAGAETSVVQRWCREPHRTPHNDTEEHAWLRRLTLVRIIWDWRLVIPLGCYLCRKKKHGLVAGKAEEPFSKCTQ
jgi:hypothetical protein